MTSPHRHIKGTEQREQRDYRLDLAHRQTAGMQAQYQLVHLDHPHRLHRAQAKYRPHRNFVICGKRQRHSFRAISRRNWRRELGPEWGL